MLKTPKNITVLFVAGFGPIVRDPVASRKFYSEALGLAFEEDSTGYLHTSELEGVKHFALWPLAQAAALARINDQIIFTYRRRGSNLTLRISKKPPRS